MTLVRRDRLYIGGAWVPPAGPGSVAVLNPFTETEIGHVPAGTREDVDRAVAAARAAFPAWRDTPLADRLAYLEKARAILADRSGDLAWLITQEAGTPILASRATQVGYPLRVLAGLRAAAANVAWTYRLGTTLVVSEPAGVAAAITPWNYPLQQSIAKVGPALAAGCTVVLKPSELAPLCLFELAGILHEAGLPGGVFNLVTGDGPDAGAALVAHESVSVVSFTGSTATGKAIGAAAAAGVRRLVSELGGKSPSVVLGDGDATQAATATAARCFGNAGQTCAALTRLIVPRAALAEVEQTLAAEAGRLRMGDPAEEITTLGPVISAGQRASIGAYVTDALAQGARLIAGGPGAAVPGRGHFVAATVLSDVTASMTVAQEEIFGPVLCVMPYDTEDEALRIANDSRYGLAAAVWSSSPQRAVAFARRIEAGMVSVNGGRLNLDAPFGGVKQSGNGREFGADGIREFLETKAVNFPSGEIAWPAGPAGREPGPGKGDTTWTS